MLFSKVLDCGSMLLSICSRWRYKGNCVLLPMAVSVAKKIMNFNGIFENRKQRNLLPLPPRMGGALVLIATYLNGKVLVETER